MKKIMVLVMVLFLLGGCGMSTLVNGPSAQWELLKDSLTPSSSTASNANTDDVNPAAP